MKNIENGLATRKKLTTIEDEHWTSKDGQSAPSDGENVDVSLVLHMKKRRQTPAPSHYELQYSSAISVSTTKST